MIIKKTNFNRSFFFLAPHNRYRPPLAVMSSNEYTIYFQSIPNFSMRGIRCYIMYFYLNIETSQRLVILNIALAGINLNKRICISNWSWKFCSYVNILVSCLYSGVSGISKRIFTYRRITPMQKPFCYSLLCIFYWTLVRRDFY